MKTSVFLSHSSKDKPIVRKLAKDLKAKGIQVWLDEWEIYIGDSIPQKVQEGLKSCNYLAVWLTQEAVSSGWVEKEWQAKIHEEISEKQIKVLPLLAEKCEIPYFLKSKKYADFRRSYDEGLNELLKRIENDKGDIKANTLSSETDAKRRDKTQSKKDNNLEIGQSRIKQYLLFLGILTATTLGYLLISKDKEIGEAKWIVNLETKVKIKERFATDIFQDIIIFSNYILHDSLTTYETQIFYDKKDYSLPEDNQNLFFRIMISRNEKEPTTQWRIIDIKSSGYNNKTLLYWKSITSREKSTVISADSSEFALRKILQEESYHDYDEIKNSLYPRLPDLTPSVILIIRRQQWLFRYIENQWLSKVVDFLGFTNKLGVDFSEIHAFKYTDLDSIKLPILSISFWDKEVKSGKRWNEIEIHENLYREKEDNTFFKMQSDFSNHYKLSQFEEKRSVRTKYQVALDSLILKKH